MIIYVCLLFIVSNQKWETDVFLHGLTIKNNAMRWVFTTQFMIHDASVFSWVVLKTTLGCFI
jgi:hypothetical protein